MEKIVIGEKFQGKYDFRETCFGIYEKNGKLLLGKKNNQYTLIGGGIEDGESREDCLKREFMEESGYEILNLKELISIDCFWMAAGQYPFESLANIYVVEINEKSKHIPIEDIELKFIDVDRVVKILPLPYHKKAVEYYLKNKKVILCN